MSQLPRIPFPAKTPFLFLAALLTTSTAVHAQSETATISRPGGLSPVQEHLDGTAENHRAIVIEAHIDGKSEQQPMSRQKRIRVLRSSEPFDDAEVDALVERLVKNMEALGTPMPKSSLKPLKRSNSVISTLTFSLLVAKTWILSTAMWCTSWRALMGPICRRRAASDGGRNDRIV